MSNYELGMAIANKVCDDLMDNYFSSREQDEERHNKADLYPHLVRPARGPSTIKKTMTIEIEVDLDISAKWDRGFPGNQETPEEPAGYELDSFTAKFRGVDVSDMIEDPEVQALLEEHEED